MNAGNNRLKTVAKGTRRCGCLGISFRAWIGWGFNGATPEESRIREIRTCGSMRGRRSKYLLLCDFGLHFNIGDISKKRKAFKGTGSYTNTLYAIGREGGVDMSIFGLFKPDVRKLLSKKDVKGLINALKHKNGFVRSDAAKAL